MKKSKNEANRERYVGDGKQKKLKSNKSQRHGFKQQLHELSSSYLEPDDFDELSDPFYGQE